MKLALALLCAAAMGAPAASGEDYNQHYRLQFHFSPPHTWTNDPNGLVFYQGEYHLFYQDNPFGTKWGHMSWGHAVSNDLVHWRNLPVAIPEENGIMIFSGSAVVDAHNSSGLCQPHGGDPGCLIAIYTGHRPGLQTQNLAVSQDRGRTWTKYAHNPVLDLHLKDFRDPKVIWYEPGQYWVMATAVAQERRIRFFRSTDLIHWRQLSDFGPAGATGGVWECPDLFELPVEGTTGKRWVLIVNINPGGVAGGSGTQYFVGRFDGERFSNDYPSGTELWCDFGKDYYAAVSFFGNPPGDTRRLMLGWFSNWLYANDTPESGWRGAMALPRQVTLTQTAQGIRLRQQPVHELEGLRTAPFTLEPNRELTSELALPAGLNELEASFDPGTAASFGFRVLGDAGHHTTAGFDRASGTVFVDRTQSGDVSFSPHFAGRQTAKLPSGNRASIRLFIDHSSVEVFAGNGEATVADRVFPPAGADKITAFATGGAARLISLRGWKLQSVWGTGPGH